MGLYKRENLENGAEICVWEISEDEDELRRLCAPIPSDEPRYGVRKNLL